MRQNFINIKMFIKLGANKLSIEDLKAQLEKEKRVFKVPACAYGLYLSKVFY